MILLFFLPNCDNIANFHVFLQSKILEDICYFQVSILGTSEDTFNLFLTLVLSVKLTNIDMEW